MALDIEKLKKASTDLAARMTRGGGPSMKFFKPADGKNVIRILPPWTPDGAFAGSFHREVHQHWNVNEDSPGPILCPKKTPHCDDTECPICDFVDQLRSRKSDVEAQELAKNLRAKAAYLMSVVVIADPVYTAKDVADWTKERPDTECPFEVGETKVQCYAASNTIAEQIFGTILDSGTDITDLTEGQNIVITKYPNKDRMKTRYVVTVGARSKLALPEGFTLPDLSKIGSVRKYDDMVKLLSEGAGANMLRLPESAGEEVQEFNDDATVEGTGDDLEAEMQAKLGKNKKK